MRHHILFAIVLLTAGAARAQTPVPDQAGEMAGAAVVSIRVVSQGQDVRDPQIASLLEVRPGEPLSMGAVRRTIGRIMGLGIYQDVQVRGRREPGGVALDVELVPRREVRRLVFRGQTGLPDRQLRDVVAARFGPMPAVGRAADMASTLEDAHRDHGFLRASVRASPLDDPGAQPGDLVFDVSAGARARIRSLTFRGSPDDVVAQVRAGLGLREGADYEPAALQASLASFVATFRREGFLEARADRFAAVSEGKDAVDLTILVTRGPRVTVQFAGDALPAREQRNLVPVATEGSADEDLLEDSERAIEDFLRARGYRDAKAPFTRSESADRLAIVFTVTRGPLYRVAGITLAGVAPEHRDAVAALLQTKPGDPFVQARLDRDVDAIVQDHRRRGYAAASVEPAIVLGARGPGVTEVPVTVTLVVLPGSRQIVRAVAFDGAAALPERHLIGLIRTTAGSPFYAPVVEDDRVRLLGAYRDRGYRTAGVDVTTTSSADGTGVDVRFVIREGPQILVDHVFVVGTARTSEATIRRELALRPGEALGDAAVAESQRNLAALGLFRRVTISELSHEAGTLHDVLISVEEAPATSIGYGGGVEFQKVETSEFAPRGFFEVGRRNLWGKNRSVSLFSRVSLRRHGAITTDAGAAGTEGKTDLEYRVVGSYREPRFLDSSGDLQIATVFEQGSRTSFRYRHRSARVEFARRTQHDWSVIGNFAITRNDVFDDRINQADRPLIDRLFPQVRLSSVSGTVARDSRNDAIEPGGGGLVSLNSELALRQIGSEVGYAKAFVQGFLYRRLPASPRLVFAGGARLGLGTGFTRHVEVVGLDGRPELNADGAPRTIPVRDLPVSERFFAGGDTSVRGFDLDRLGTAGTFDRDGTPIGGHAELILNGEVRVALWRDLGVVGFLDAGNVFPNVNDFDVSDLRAGAGFGLRYKSPVGPIRLDVGFKLGTLRTFGAHQEKRFAVHISIGQAF